MNLEIGQEFEVAIDRLGINGEGVAKYEGFTLFIEGALPQEIVKVKLYEKRKNFGRADIVSFVVKSKHRVTPPCKVFGDCGGCQLMHLDYSQQLDFKRQRVVDALERIGKFTNVFVAPCVDSPSELAYRNKIQMPSAPNAPFRLGLYARQSHDLVEIDQCHIHCSLGETVLKTVKTILSAAFDAKTLSLTETPVIKHVLIKTAVKTQEVLVILVTNKEDDDFFSPIAQAIMNQISFVKGVVQNIQPRDSNVILGDHYRTLCGNAWIHDNVLGNSIKISAASFFQVNPLQAEQLYLKAIDLCGLNKTQIVLDAYCGVGALSLALGKKAKEVIGVECVPDAILNAKENAACNHVSNMEFVCAHAEQFIRGLVLAKRHIDVALLNPPRKGCESEFLLELIKLSPQSIVYISCDPATLARDLKILCDGGYALDGVYPFDMFPQTAHVECVVKLKATN